VITSPRDPNAWLAGHAGGQVNAPKKADNRKYPVIEPIPGRYVKDKAP
jgi:polyhydroxyalkanoate synthase